MIIHFLTAEHFLKVNLAPELWWTWDPAIKVESILCTVIMVPNTNPSYTVLCIDPGIFFL